MSARHGADELLGPQRDQDDCQKNRERVAPHRRWCRVGLSGAAVVSSVEEERAETRTSTYFVTSIELIRGLRKDAVGVQCERTSSGLSGQQNWWSATVQSGDVALYVYTIVSYKDETDN